MKNRGDILTRYALALAAVGALLLALSILKEVGGGGDFGGGPCFDPSEVSR